MTLKKVLLAVFLIASASALAKDKSITAAVTDQHMALGILAAIFYCENEKWPENLLAVRAFYENDEIELPVAPDWEALSDSRAIYTVDKEVVLLTPADPSRKLVAIRSTHSPPGCDGDNINPQISLVLGVK